VVTGFWAGSAAKSPGGESVPDGRVPLEAAGWSFHSSRTGSLASDVADRLPGRTHLARRAEAQIQRDRRFRHP